MPRHWHSSQVKPFHPFLKALFLLSATSASCIVPTVAPFRRGGPAFNQRSCGLTKAKWLLALPVEDVGKKHVPYLPRRRQQCSRSRARLLCRETACGLTAQQPRSKSSTSSTTTTNTGVLPRPFVGKLYVYAACALRRRPNAPQENGERVRSSVVHRNTGMLLLRALAAYSDRYWLPLKQESERMRASGGSSSSVTLQVERFA